MRYQIQYACVSHIGLVRRANQDNYICDTIYMKHGRSDVQYPLCGMLDSDSGGVLGVFDGMGGEQCGEDASRIAAQEASAIQIGDQPVAALSEYCRRANAEICRFARENGISSTGTTAAMLAFDRQGVTLCNVGDSRIFHYTAGGLEQISMDHVIELPGRAKPPLSQNLGIEPREMRIDPYFSQGAYNDGDVYLICSDGLTDMLNEQEIASCLNIPDVADAAAALLQRALAAGGRDNVTVIVCRVRRERMSILERVQSAISSLSVGNM